MSLDLLYARIPIDLHESELERVCSAYKQELCKQLQEMASEVAEADLFHEDELKKVQDKLLSLESFVSPTQIKIRKSGNKRQGIMSQLESFRKQHPEIVIETPSRKKMNVDGEMVSDSDYDDATTASNATTSNANTNTTSENGRDARLSPVTSEKGARITPQDVSSLLLETTSSRGSSPAVSRRVSRHLLNYRSSAAFGNDNSNSVDDTSTLLRPTSVEDSGGPLNRMGSRKISFIGEEVNIDDDGKKTSPRQSPSQHQSPFAASPGGTSSYQQHQQKQQQNQNQNQNDDDSFFKRRTSSVNSSEKLSRSMSVTFGEVVSEEGGGEPITDNNNNNNLHHLQLPSTNSRKPSLANLARKASELSRRGSTMSISSRRGSSAGGPLSPLVPHNNRRGSTKMPQSFNSNNPLFVPEVSAVKTDWVQNLEEAYLRTVGHREELIEALRVISENASGPNTMKCVSSTMWAETRRSVNAAIENTTSNMETNNDDGSSNNNVIPTAVKTIFSTDGGLASSVEDSTIQVATLPLLPHSSATWDELASDANPKPPKNPSNWDLPTQKDIDEYFSFIDKTTKPPNPFTPLIEIMKYELTLFTHTQKHKRAPVMGRDRILKSTVIAKRMLQDSITKLERLETLYDKEIQDFLNVCRALQKLYIREKRDADSAIGMYEARQKSLENLALLRAATIVDDEAFAVAGGARTESPDVTIGDAVMRNGMMVVDVGVRCRQDQSSLLEELDRMMLDTGLRHNRIKRFVDYVDDFVDRIEKFDDEVDASLRCPVCNDVSTELVSFWPCGHNFCINCVPEAEESDEGNAYGAFCTVCGTNSRESYVQNFNASSISARVRFRHAGCGELRSDARKLRSIVLGSTAFRHLPGNNNTNTSSNNNNSREQIERQRQLLQEDGLLDD